MFFIVGVGRSGTTLLQNMLNNHPDIAFIPEINYTRRFLFNNHLSKIHTKGKEEFISYLKNDKWISRLDDGIISKLNFDQISRSSFAIDIYDQILSFSCELAKKPIAGDKDPRSLELVSKINRIIPNIHWIHIIRDPRDVLLSKMKADWSKDKAILKHIFATRIQLYLALKWKQLLPKTFTELYYEDLITDPENTLKTLCSSINIEYNPRMLNYEESATRLVAKDEYSWKKEVFSPIMQSNQSKWKKGLNDWQVVLVENLVEPAFDDYNYEKSSHNLNIFQRLKLLWLKSIFTISSKLFIWFRSK